MPRFSDKTKITGTELENSDVFILENIDGDDNGIFKSELKIGLGVTQLESDFAAFKFNKTFVVDTYTELISLTEMVENDTAWVNDLSQSYTYFASPTGWQSDTDVIETNVPDKIQKDFIGSEVTVSEQLTGTDNLDTNSAVKELYANNTGVAKTINKIYLEAGTIYSSNLFSVIFSSTGGWSKTLSYQSIQSGETKGFLLSSELVLEDQETLTATITGEEGGNFNLLENGVSLNNKLTTLTSTYSQVVSTVSDGIEIETEPVAASTIANADTGKIKLFLNSENSNKLYKVDENGNTVNLELLSHEAKVHFNYGTTGATGYLYDVDFNAGNRNGLVCPYDGMKLVECKIWIADPTSLAAANIQLKVYKRTLAQVNSDISSATTTILITTDTNKTTGFYTDLFANISSSSNEFDEGDSVHINISVADGTSGESAIDGHIFYKFETT